MSSPNTHRPTLISGQPASPASGSHRILADMEGRGGRATAAAERAAAATRQRPWPWKWLILAAVATTLLLASLAVFRATSSRDDGVSTASPFAPLPAEPATASHEQDRGAAMIVDDPSASATGASTAAVSAQADQEPAAAAGQPVATAAAPADAAPAAAGRTPARTSAAARTRPRKAEDADLLATLLGIIKQKETTETPRHESMDTLIAEIQARDRKERAESDAMFDSMSRRNAASTSDPAVQARLRRCPPANTLKGIDCRRRICAALAGKDAACAAQ